VEPGKDIDLPVRLVLSGYPNPARESINLRLGIPSTAASERIEVKVYDVTGRCVKQVYNGRLEPGFHDLNWDGTNHAGRKVSSGIYFLLLNSPADEVGKKVVLVR
jgi:flagellar hook assembly protein FlgD